MWTENVQYEMKPQVGTSEKNHDERVAYSACNVERCFWLLFNEGGKCMFDHNTNVSQLRALSRQFKKISSLSCIVWDLSGNYNIYFFCTEVRRWNLFSRVVAEEQLHEHSGLDWIIGWRKIKLNEGKNDWRENIIRTHCFHKGQSCQRQIGPNVLPNSISNSLTLGNLLFLPGYLCCESSIHDFGSAFLSPLAVLES